MSLFKRAEKEVQPQGERKSLLKTPLLPHQQRVVDKIKDKPGILMYHGVGLGKSLGSLAALDSLGQKGTVVTPAALKSNILKERDKHFEPGLEMDVDSLENVARKQTTAKNPTLLIDEAHKLRDPASKSLQALKKINKNVDKTILMTGTPMVNSPADIAPLINLVSHNNTLPENRAEFEKKFVYNKTVNPSFWQSLKGIKPGEVPVLNKNEKGNLQKIFSDWVDYEKGNREGLPDVEEQEIKVPMSKGQLAIYDTVMNQAPSWVASKIRSNLPPNKQESQQLNAYLQAARQVSNTTAPFIQKGKAESPKIQKAFEELKKMMDANPNGKAVIYSNYLKAGLDPYKELLTQNNIPFGEFTGSVHQKDRDQMVKDYNEGKLKALLLSSAGQTGLDLRNTNLVQLMESGWNEPSLEQAKARAIRYMSHASLPPEQRKVLVQKFLSTRPETLSQRLGLSDKEFAVDEYLQTLSKNKANLISQFEELMKQPQQAQQKIAFSAEIKNKGKSVLKPVSLSNSLKEVLKAAKRSGFKGQNFNPNKFKFKKIAKVEDKVLKFQESKDYSFLFKNIKSPKFRSLLKKQNEDPAFTNFVNNMGKHYSAARKGESFEVPSEKNPSKIYKVRKHSDKSFTCSCPSYQFVKSTVNGDCKHIDKIKNKPNTVKVAEAIVPYHKQSTQKTCSSASLRMVLAYYGDERPEGELSKLIGVHNSGADGPDIVKAARKLGYRAEYKSISTQEAIDLLDNKIPIIMDGRSFKYDGKFHWTVLCDIQLDNNKAILADPNYEGKYRHLTLKELDYYWNSKEMYKPHRDLKRYGVIVKKKL